MSRTVTITHYIPFCGDECPYYRDELIDEHHGCAWTPPKCLKKQQNIYRDSFTDFPVFCPLKEDNVLP